MQMPRFKLLILLLTLFFEVHGQQLIPDTTARKIGLKNAIKKAYFGDSKIVSKIWTEFYDKDGKLTKQTVFDYYINSISICTYFYYNNKGQLEETRIISYLPNDSTIDTQKYSYNSKGQLDLNFKGKIKYKYDDLGLVIESVEKTAKSSDMKTIYSYDSLGQLVSKEEYLHDSMDCKRIFSYNVKGKILKIKSTHYDSQKSDLYPYSEYEFTYLYNDKGLVTTEYQMKTIPSFADKSDNKIYTYEYLFY
jgi:hypothetical protein